MTEAVNVKPERPRYRNIGLGNVIFNYRLPAPGLVSILHRISGVLLFVSLPFLLGLFGDSLISEISFEKFRAVIGHPVGKLVLIVLSWAYLHHFCAGLRHVMMDMDIGLNNATSKNSAMAVLVLSLTLAALVAAKIMGAF